MLLVFFKIHNSCTEVYDYIVITRSFIAVTVRCGTDVCIYNLAKRVSKVQVNTLQVSKVELSVF